MSNCKLRWSVDSFRLNTEDHTPRSTPRRQTQDAGPSFEALSSVESSCGGLHAKSRPIAAKEDLHKPVLGPVKTHGTRRHSVHVHRHTIAVSSSVSSQNGRLGELHMTRRISIPSFFNFPRGAFPAKWAGITDEGLKLPGVNLGCGPGMKQRRLNIHVLILSLIYVAFLA